MDGEPPKALRAYAETRVSVLVQTTDLDNLTVLLAETKLEALPARNPVEQEHIVMVPH